jgi:dihydroflavonol-4-reductase
VSRAFLTGGSGLVGGALLVALRGRGDEVVALARSEAAAATVSARGAEVARGDVLDEDALADGMRGCDLVYHVAGVNTLCPDDPAELIHANVRGAEIAVRAAARAGVRRLVLTSSASSLGEEKGTVGSEASPHRGWYMSIYERSKHEGEQAALAAGAREGVEVVSVNPSSVQGPGRAGGTGKILIAYLNGRLRAFVDTDISLVDIRDCTEGHLLAAERGRPGERYVLSGATLTSREALEIVSGMTGLTERPRLLPPALASAAASLAERGFRLARRSPPVCRAMVRTMLHGHRYDGSRAERELGVRYTPVRDTFARTIEWAIADGRVKRPLPAWPPSQDSPAAGSGIP